MRFNENLQNLRKIKNISQEQLAEKLEVSRQAVSKWESGTGYPETDKLITISEIFDCSLDDLIKGNISIIESQETLKYDKLQNKISKGISFGVFLILIGISILVYFAGIAEIAPENLQEKYEVLGVIIFLVTIAISTPIFIVLGIEEEEFEKKYPRLLNIYTEEQIDRFNKKFGVFIASGVSLILIGIIQLITLYELNIVSESSTIPVVILLVTIAISTYIFIYSCIQKEKFEIEKYNRKHTEEAKRKNNKADKISGVIMLSATGLFLTAGWLFNAWHISWITFPIGGILCAIVGTIFNNED